VQFGAGVQLHAQLGDRVKKGEPLMTLFTDTEEKFARALGLVEQAFSISEQTTIERKLILHRIS
jgi:thymidine phosphorylase